MFHSHTLHITHRSYMIRLKNIYNMKEENVKFQQSKFFFFFFFKILRLLQNSPHRQMAFQTEACSTSKCNDNLWNISLQHAQAWVFVCQEGQLLITHSNSVSKFKVEGTCKIRSHYYKYITAVITINGMPDRWHHQCWKR